MGRATVISGGTDGRYVIEMDYGLAQRDARVAKLDATLAVLAIRKAAQQIEVDGFQGGLDSFQGEADPLIDAYRAALLAVPPVAGQAEAIRKQIDTLTQDIVKQQLWLAQAKAALAHTDLEIQQLTLDRAALMALEITEQRPAWCADLTEDAAGEVATIEVPGESALILIAPQAPAPVAADGVLTAREIQSPAQVYWNAAVLPGWQKFKPTHRWGTITALDTYADTATVALAAAVSSAQALDVNQAEVLTGIPVVYMECHASVFNVGDNVIVGFTGQDWAQPKVIGFLDHPRACGGPSLYCIPADGTNIYGWSPPVSDGGGPINGGKGSAAYYGIPGDPNPVVVDGTNRTAGVTSPFVRAGVGLQPRVTRGVRADVAGLPAHGPTNVGNSPDADNYSSMSRAMLEWVSSGHGTVVTYFDRVRVNGADKGVPAVDGVAGAPVKAFIPQKVGDNPDFIFAVALVSGGASLQFFTRPLAGDSSVAWTLLDTLVMGDIVSTPSVGVSNLNRVLVHPEATELAIWFSEGVAGVGHLVVNPYTAGYTFTQAPSTYGRTPSVNYVPASGTYVYSFEFKFSIDYVDGSLAYATVTGTRTHILTQIDGPPYPPEHYHAGQVTFASTEVTIDEVITADFWGTEVTLSNYHFHSYGITNYVTVGDIGLIEPSDYSQEASLVTKQVYYYGGPNDPILYTTKDYPLTVTYTESYLDSWLAGRCVSDPGCFAAAGHAATQRIPAMTVKNCVLHNGNTIEMSSVGTPQYVAVFGAQPADYTLPALALGNQTAWQATWLEGEWGRTYWYPSSPAITAQAILNVFRTIISLGTAETFANTGSSYHTTAYFLEGSVNLRHLGGFAIFSNPALTYPSEVFLTEPSVETSGSIIRFKHPPTLATNADHDYSLWHTWCSDPAALSRYALTLAAAPPATGRLKHLQINSAA